jgi:cytoskeletal protein RodZ
VLLARKSLKKDPKSKALVVDGERPSLIMLLSLSALLVLVGVFVVQKGLASNWWAAQPEATPVATPTPTPAGPTASPSASPSPQPTQGPSRRPLY